MNIQRKLTLVVATGAVALGAGHFVQKRAADRVAAAPVIVSAVEPLAAGPEVTLMPKIDVTAPILASEPATVSPPEARGAEVQVAEVLPAAEPIVETPNCGPLLELISQPGAMIGLTLLAPCNANERIVLHHAGLVVTGRTTASGAYFASVPALTAVSEVQIVFASGSTTTASIDMPEASRLHRFGVQWQDVDDFQLNAFENGANYNQTGHISAAFTGIPGDGGFLTILGDSSTDLPLLAEVYTFGKDPKADIVIEAAVTQATCGRELLGETLSASDGNVEITDLTIAMPDCEAIGDILVLKNPDQDMKLAAAN